MNAATADGRQARVLAGALSLAVLSLPFAGLVSPADAAPKPEHYASCKALNEDYPHGVGKKGAKDKTSGKRVTNFKVSDKVYGMNNGKRNPATGEYDLDRDNDGIACEKR